jgi:hypothetical protein
MEMSSSQYLKPKAIAISNNNKKRTFIQNFAFGRYFTFMATSIIKS